MENKFREVISFTVYIRLNNTDEIDKFYATTMFVSFVNDFISYLNYTFLNLSILF